MNILITSGGTKISIDRVRDITNMSSGTFGAKIATEALKAGHKVTFLKAKDSKSPFSTRVNFDRESLAVAMQRTGEIYELYAAHHTSYWEFEYRTFDDYHIQLKAAVMGGRPDIVILAAAVSDYGAAAIVEGKMRSSVAEMNIPLVALPKIISQVKSWYPRTYLVGFKLLVDSTDEQLIEAAQHSIRSNHCDMIVANDLRDMKNNAHCLTLVYADEKDDVFGCAACPNEPQVYHQQISDPNFLAKVVVTGAAAGLRHRESLK